MNKILGFHFGHDSSITLLENGIPKCCMSEEKLSRVKMYYGAPLLSLEYIMKKYNISPKDINQVAVDTLNLPRLIGPSEMRQRFSKKDKKKEIKSNLNKSKKVLNYVLGVNINKQIIKNKEEESKSVFYEEMNKIGFPKEKILFIDHHYCHAATAFWPSPFHEAIVFTSDGRGDGISSTISYAKGKSIKRICKIGELDSVGQFYSAVTAYLGYKPLRHEGKITGLAAHGDPSILGEKFYSNIRWDSDGTYTFNLPDKYECRDPEKLSEFFGALKLSFKDKVVLNDQGLRGDILISAKWHGQIAYLSDIAKDYTKEDISAGVQYFAEKVSVEFLNRHLKETPMPVVLAGGVFANVRINQKIKELPNVSNVFVQPAMGDDGLSLGAALVAYSKNNKSTLDTFPRSMEIKNTYYGPRIENEDILSYLEDNNIKYDRFPNISEEVAKWIDEGKIIGYFQGNLEYGPRALGHRSILVRPTDKSINNSLNKRLNRTEFMPFAPAVISEKADEYFIGYEKNQLASEYMTITYDVFKERQKEIEAVVHVDGTARPQIVLKSKEPIYHDIIYQYYKISGIPVIINTSFNAHEEPIVFTPDDAYKSFINGSVDILVMEDIVIR